MVFRCITTHISAWVHTLQKRLASVSCTTLAITISLGLLLFGLLFKLLLQPKLLGDGPTLQGGSLGRRIDNTHKRWLFDHIRNVDYQRAFEHALGYPVPPCPEPRANAQGVPVLLSTYLTETLQRTQQRQALQKQAATVCPRCWFRPMLGDWYGPPIQGHGIEEIPYWESEMDLYMLQRYGSTNVRLLELYQSFMAIDKAHLWGLAMLWDHGGVFEGSVEHERDWDAFFERGKGREEDAQGMSIMAMEEGASTSSLQLRYAVARAPKSPDLKCLFDEESSFFLNEHAGQSSVSSILEYLKQVQQCLTDETNNNDTFECCRPNENNLSKDKTPTAELLEPNLAVESVAVSIEEVPQAARNSNNVRVHKRSHADRMKDNNDCTPGWFCNRCLRMPWRGTLASCASFCNRCYVDQITSSSSDLDSVEILVQVQEQAPSTTTPPLLKKRIPRILHQTWFEELTEGHYPHLTRLQNSWKASGWDYRFYTDTSAQEYIQRHFPQRFVDAYNAILPGAFKADFFRLLALLKDGGVYADVDVQLDTNLDQMIPANLSFFVPRDVPIDRWPHSNYCLWNGLMGAAPGHRIIAQAAQDLLQAVEQRYDYYDVEHRLCRESMDCEIWKLRSIPILILTGPCALGISVNAALGHSNKVEGFDLGWLVPNETATTDRPDRKDYGDMLILLTDRYDMGELRFTDVDRGLLVASTNADKLLTSPLNPKNTRRNTAHYSKSETDIMGTTGMYVDDLVSNSAIRITIHHQVG